MFHIAAHFVVPFMIAIIVYPRHWKFALLIMVATMLVDLDHLLASPVYDPERCSIGFHPLHTLPAILVYVFLTVLPLLVRKQKPLREPGRLLALHLIGLGLLIHMALDGLDCLQGA